MTEENMENTGGEATEGSKGAVSQEELDKLVAEQMQAAAGEAADEGQADQSGAQDDVKMPNMVQKAQFPELNPEALEEGGQNIGLLLDVPMPVSIELGSTTMTIEEILNLGPGSVVELNKLAGEPVDLLVNNKPIAKGEVVVVDENFGVRVTNLVSHQDKKK